jgi:hypothetical protein
MDVGGMALDRGRTAIDEGGAAMDEEPGEATGMDVRDAALIMREAGEHARHELTINRPAIFVSWSLVYLLGYGLMWFSVRNQHPYQAPPGWALAVVIVLAAMALAVTAALTDRATSGVGGTSATRRRVYWLSLVIGLIGVYIMQPVLLHAGASPNVMGVFSASSPLLVAGVVLIAGTAAWLNWYAFSLGVWLIAVAAFSGFAGPAGVWAVEGLAIGAPFLAMGVISFARGRR